MKVYQVVLTAVITSEDDPILVMDGEALIEKMAASDTAQLGSRVIGEAVDVDDLCEGVIIDGVRFGAPAEAS